MKYEVKREGPYEIHTVTLHAVEQEQAKKGLKPGVYNPLIAQPAIAPRLFALAMIANVIELQVADEAQIPVQTPNNIIPLNGQAFYPESHGPNGNLPNN